MVTRKDEQQYKVIVGLGSTGLSCARFFHTKGIPFRVVDSRFSPPCLATFEVEFPFAEVELGGFTEATLMSAQELVVSPGVSLSTPEIAKAIAAGVPVTGDIDIFRRYCKQPLVAITGSNGKSTVVTLIAEMAQRAGFNIGVGGNLDGRASMPALDMLSSDARELYLLELSSFQLETTQQLDADIATILNVSEDHMDRYDSMEDYRAAKLRIFDGCKLAIVNRNDETTLPPETFRGQVVSIGFDVPLANEYGIRALEGREWLVLGDECLIALDDIKLVGRHNVANAMVALAVAMQVGIPVEHAVETLRQFQGLPHRCQWVRSLRGVDYYNDSKGTNVNATCQAIDGVAQKTSGSVYLIAGGLAKEADFGPLVPLLRNHVAGIVLIGRDGQMIADAVSDAVKTEFADSLEEAVIICREKAVAGDAVLLSPACASQDMFKDFAHRGRVFVATVEGLQ